MRHSIKRRALTARQTIFLAGTATLLAISLYALGRSTAQQQQRHEGHITSTLPDHDSEPAWQVQQASPTAADTIAGTLPSTQGHVSHPVSWVEGYARMQALLNLAKANKVSKLERLVRLLVDGRLLGQPMIVSQARRLYAQALAELQAKSDTPLQHLMHLLSSTTTSSGDGASMNPKGSIHPSDDLATFVSTAFSMLANPDPAQPSIVPCSQDAAAAQALQQQAQQGRRVLIAVTLKDSAHLMPNFITQLLQLLLWMPPTSAVVSIYESGSTDDTASWLRLLQLMLEPIGVASNITANGSLVRAKDEERIQYLATVRNAVLSPVFSHRARQHGGSSGDSSSSSSGDSRLASARGRYSSTRNSRLAAGSEAQGIAGYSSGCFEPDSVLFINDVYWCADAAARLLLHEADVACGLDYGRVETEEAVKAAGHGCCYRRRGRRLAAMQRRRQRRLLQQQQQQQEQQEKEQQQQTVTLSKSLRQLQGVRMVTWQDIVDNRHRPHFGLHSFPMYDTWVVRDVTGMRLKWRRPYGHSSATNQQLAAGLPFPAYACWGGMAKVAAEPFRRGVRFRTHVDGECRASECSLLVDDLHRLDFRRVVIDPYVRTAYDYQTAYAAHVDDGRHFAALTGIRLARWHEKAVQQGVDWTAPASRPDYANVECCSKEPDTNAVVFEACRPLDVMHKNHTHTFLEQCMLQKSTGHLSAKQQRSYVIGHTQFPDGVWDKVSKAPCPEL